MISILRAADRIVVPWKNGGGVTREVSIWPPNSGFDDFGWRVSIAEVREAGPFSRFAGIDRMLTILEGRIVLTFDDRRVELDRKSAPFAFSGDAACFGAPIDGTVTDLNVMTRRGRCAACVTPVANETHQMAAKITLLVARYETMVRSAGQTFTLRPHDALQTDESCRMAIAGEAFVIAMD